MGRITHRKATEMKHIAIATILALAACGGSPSGASSPTCNTQSAFVAYGGTSAIGVYTLTITPTSPGRLTSIVYVGSMDVPYVTPTSDTSFPQEGAFTATVALAPGKAYGYNVTIELCLGTDPATIQIHGANLDFVSVTNG